MARSCLLYYITDRTAFAPDETTRRCRLLDKIAEAVRAGVDFIQLREKDLPAKDLECLASEAMRIVSQLRTENRKLRTALLVNSRSDIALAVGADGVHLRSDDISPQDISAIWQKYGAEPSLPQLSPRSPVIAVSCHSREDVMKAAAEGANFAVLAPVFEKKGGAGAQPKGASIFKDLPRTGIPVLALGGITLSNAHRCLESGADGIAAIRLFQENPVAEVAERLRS